MTNTTRVSPLKAFNTNLIVNNRIPTSYSTESVSNKHNCTSFMIISVSIVQIPFDKDMQGAYIKQPILLINELIAVIETSLIVSAHSEA